MSDSSLRTPFDDIERVKCLYQLLLEWGMKDGVAKANAVNIVYQRDITPESFDPSTFDASQVPS